MRLEGVEPSTSDPKSGALSIELQAHIILIYHFMKKKKFWLLKKRKITSELMFLLIIEKNDFSRTRIKKLILIKN